MKASPSPAPVPAPAAPPGDVWVIEPRRPGLLPRLREVVAYRYLVPYFGKRAIERLYRRTLLGWTWILLRPLLPLLIYTIVFARFLGVQTHGVPYFLFFLVGMGTWQLFERSLMWATRSLEMNRRLLTRLYFPHLILPFASTAPALIEFLIYVVLTLLTLAYFWLASGTLYASADWTLAVALVGPLLGFALALSVGLWTSVLAVNARDVRWTLSYVLTGWFFLTPIAYPIDVIPPGWRWLVLINPMAPVVETVKWGVLGIGTLDVASLGVSALVTALVAVSGLWFFARRETVSVDQL